MNEIVQHPRVSIVENDSLVRAALKDCVESANHLVTEFTSAEELLTSDCVHETDCLILDLQLPGMNGFELQNELTELGFRFPIVFLTAHYQEETRERAMREGAAAFLRKPIRRDSLLRSIQAAIEGRSKRPREGGPPGRPSRRT